jgi:hypothetical protein
MIFAEKRENEEKLIEENGDWGNKCKYKWGHGHSNGCTTATANTTSACGTTTFWYTTSNYRQYNEWHRKYRSS